MIKNNIQPEQHRGGPFFPEENPHNIQVEQSAGDLIFPGGDFYKKLLFLNIGIFILVTISYCYGNPPAILGGFIIIFFLTVQATLNPIRAFFLFFGIKLTFDGLWFIQVPYLATLNMNFLVLITIPLLILVFFKGRIGRDAGRWPIYASILYLIWTFLGKILNDYNPNLNLVIRQAGMLFGMLMGMKYIKSQRDIEELSKVVFLSTVIPVLAQILQFVLYKMGIPFLFHTPDSIREQRLSGMYFDAATAGTVYLVSLACNIYIIMFARVAKNYKRLLYLFYLLTLFCIIVGATRSVMVTALILTVFFLLKNIKKNIILIPLILILGIYSQSYFEKVFEHTRREFKTFSPDDYENILYDRSYRGIFTGRVSIWQGVWNKFLSNSFTQQLFGSGFTGVDFHSVYFFLLLQIGWAGLFFYLTFHLILLFQLYRRIATHPLALMGMISLVAFLLIGISMSALIYTSFQWIVYLIVGVGLNVKSEKYDMDLNAKAQKTQYGLYTSEPEKMPVF
jgi:hypothetical protein